METITFRGDIYADDWKFTDFRKTIESHHTLHGQLGEFIDDKYEDVYKFSLTFFSEDTKNLLWILTDLKSSLVGTLSNIMTVTKNLDRAIEYLNDYLENGANKVLIDSDDTIYDFPSTNSHFLSVLEFLNPTDGSEWEVSISICNDTDKDTIDVYNSIMNGLKEAIEMTKNNTDEYIPMTLSEAIEHLEEILGDSNHDFGCESCKKEHEQLLGWLKDLQYAKQFLSFASDDLEHIGKNCCYEDCSRECESCPLISTYGEWRYKKEVDDLIRRIK